MSDDRLAEIALRICWRADDAMPNTAKALRADAELVRIAAAIVAAARDWRHGEDPVSANLLAAVDAYEGALDDEPVVMSRARRAFEEDDGA